MSSGIFKKLFGGKAKDEGLSLQAGRSIVPEMAPGPMLTLCLVYGRGADDSIADLGLTLAFQLLDQRKLKATFVCAAKLAETAATQLARIRDHGHEVACNGYQQENPQKLDDIMLPRVLMRCREVLAKRGIHPAGYLPPTGTVEPRLMIELAKQGFKYVAELRSDSRDMDPKLVLGDPTPLVHMPISSNDSGYLRHPEDPRHVFNKHHGILLRAAHSKGYVALTYHTWMLGERKERYDDLCHLVDDSLHAGIKILPFNDALPERYRPPVRVADRNEWGL